MGYIIGIIISLMIVILGFAIYADFVEFERFQAYILAHDCKVTEYMDGEVFTTVGPASNGGVAVGIGSTADKEKWTCNDGKSYWKNEGYGR